MITLNKVYTASEVIELGDAMPGSVSRWHVTIVDEGSMNISITPEGTAMGSGETKTGVGYVNQTDPSTNINGASTPITAAGHYLIESSGMDIDLDLTVSAGSVRIIAVPVRG